VRSIAFDPSNEWFVTGSADRTIKLWDTGSGQLKLTLTGHIEQVTGLAVSPRHPYMFSASLDKEVKCWDLEHNKVGGGRGRGWGVIERLGVEDQQYPLGCDSL
jgi:pleiotropic regulator 1